MAANLYWTNFSTGREWENILNWFTSDPGGALNPNLATNVDQIPWVNNNEYAAFDLQLSTSESSYPSIGALAPTTVGGNGESGTCSIGEIVVISSEIAGGTWTGDFSDSGSPSYFAGGTFTGFVTLSSGSYIQSGCTFTNASIVLISSSCNIQGGAFYGSTISNSGNVIGGTYYGSFSDNGVNGGQIYNCTFYGSVSITTVNFKTGTVGANTFSPSGTINFSSLISSGAINWSALSPSVVPPDPGFVICGGSYSPVVAVTAIPPNFSGINGSSILGLV